MDYKVIIHKALTIPQDSNTESLTLLQLKISQLEQELNNLKLEKEQVENGGTIRVHCKNEMIEQIQNILGEKQNDIMSL